MYARTHKILRFCSKQAFWYFKAATGVQIPCLIQYCPFDWTVHRSTFISFPPVPGGLAEGLTLTTSCMSRKVKVIGQRSWSLGWKCDFPSFRWADRWMEIHFIMSYDVMMPPMTYLGKSTDKEAITWEGASMLRRFHYL